MPDLPAVIADRIKLSVADETRLHVECLAYDHGRRDALRQQLKALVEQAAAQAKRSAKTADGPLAANYDRELCDRDREVWRALQAALHR